MARLIIAASSVEGLERAIATHYDLILMDIGLGTTDGFTVTQEIKAQSVLNKETPIVAMTAHSEDNYRIKAQEIGMQDFLTKPVNAQELERILNTLPKSNTSNQ